MNRYDAEMSTLFAVEQQLLNAAVSLRSAEHRLDDGQLREEIREILRPVEDTTELPAVRGPGEQPFPPP